MDVQYCLDMSLVVRKPAETGADQLSSNRPADQCLCFCYIGSPIPLLPKSEISSLCHSFVALQPGLCQTWSETQKTGFLIGGSYVIIN